MAVRNKRDSAWTPEKVRERIRASLITKRLIDHVLGKADMVPSQVTAGLGLLKKIVPDLSAVEHSGSIDTRTEKELTDAELANIASSRSTRAVEPKDSTKEPGKVH